MLGRHRILKRAIRKAPVKRLQLVKYQNNGAGIFGRGFEGRGLEHKDPKQKTAGCV